MNAVLEELLAGIAAGTVRIVDLTHTLNADFAQLSLPPEMGQALPYRSEEISRYDDRGPAWYWNNFSLCEHTGTHFDAPIHWVSGRELPNNSVDTIPAEHMIAPACVVDCTDDAERDADYLLTRERLMEWEAQHGRIPAGSWVLMHTGWCRRVNDPVAFQNYDETGQHTPGPDVDCVRFLVDERDVLGFGTETIGTDSGQAQRLNPPFPCHYYMHGAGKYGLQCLNRLDQLPPSGSVLLTAPLKLEEGSGSPLRVLALVSSAA